MKIAITGDLFLSQPETLHIDNKVKQILEGCDFRVINLEGPIPTEDCDPLPCKSGPRLRMSKEICRILEDLGADVLTLANNHLMDYGAQGFTQTKEALKGKCDLIGAGTWEEAYILHILECGGIKVGLMNLCEMQFGMLYDKWSQHENMVGCAWINHHSVDGLVCEYKKKVDYLVVIVHAGVEMVNVPLPEWRDRYRHLVDLGCDVVVAHHPHVVQGYEMYKGSPICYSLGNFCFIEDTGNTSDDWNTGYIALIQLDKNGVRLETAGVRTKEYALELMESEEWQAYLNARNNLIADEKRYMERVNEACIHLIPDYQFMFAKGGLFPADRHWLRHIARFILKRYHFVHALNNLQCESHRWCVSRAIRLQHPEII